SVLAVHVQAIGTAIDLGRPHLDQVQQPRVEAAALEVALDGQHQLHGLGAGLLEINTRGHVSSFNWGSLSGLSTVKTSSIRTPSVRADMTENNLPPARTATPASLLMVIGLKLNWSA